MRDTLQSSFFRGLLDDLHSRATLHTATPVHDADVSVPFQSNTRAPSPRRRNSGPAGRTTQRPRGISMEASTPHGAAIRSVAPWPDRAADRRPRLTRDRWVPSLPGTEPS